MDNREKENRKRLLNVLKERQKQEFESSLPMKRTLFKNLFDHLDIQLEENGCDHTNILTKTFLDNNKVGNNELVLIWLADNGGYCDCEILANVEEMFE